MNKKILLVSIIAVVILILVSFTGVVGYQTTKSTTIAKASPLFSVRSTRAIDKESKDLTCDYVGKGEENIISIPKRDNGVVLLQKFKDTISKMDDATFDRFIDLLTTQFHQDNRVNNVNTIKIKSILYQLRTNTNNEKRNYYDKNVNYNPKLDTFRFTICIWFPTCIPYVLGIIILFSLLLFFTVLCKITEYCPIVVNNFSD